LCSMMSVVQRFTVLFPGLWFSCSGG
jgi:hypothetical protein